MEALGEFGAGKRLGAHTIHPTRARTEPKDEILEEFRPSERLPLHGAITGVPDFAAQLQTLREVAHEGDDLTASVPDSVQGRDRMIPVAIATFLREMEPGPAEPDPLHMPFDAKPETRAGHFRLVVNRPHSVQGLPLIEGLPIALS